MQKLNKFKSLAERTSNFVKRKELQSWGELLTSSPSFKIVSISISNKTIFETEFEKIIFMISARFH